MRRRAGGYAIGDFEATPRLLGITLLAGMIGAVTTGAALLLVRGIALVSNLVWFGRIGWALPNMARAPRDAWMVLAPALGGLVVGLMAKFGSEKIRGHGIPEAIEAILAGRSRIVARVAVLKPLSSAIAIGTGGPFGAEGPIVMTGGALGSLVAQAFLLSDSERKTLLAAGAASGMAAIFATPVAAVLLAVEVLLFEWRPRSLVPVMGACLVAIGLRPFFFGHQPLFAYAGGAGPGAVALPPALALGLLAGGLGTGLTLALYWLEDTYPRLRLPSVWWPALGGLVVGLGGLVAPRTLGVGYDLINALLAHPVRLGAAATWLGVKSGIWLVALASGTSGGVLAPLLILGGALGHVFGTLVPGAPGFWALLGMAALLGGTLRAPLTAILFALEVSGVTATLPALLAAVGAAHTVTVLTLRRSILTEKIARRGRHVACDMASDPYALLPVRAIMQKPEGPVAASPFVHPAAPVRAAVLAMLQSGADRLRVAEAEAGPTLGVITRDALLAVQARVLRMETLRERGRGTADETATWPERPDLNPTDAPPKSAPDDVGTAPTGAAPATDNTPGDAARVAGLD